MLPVSILARNGKHSVDSLAKIRGEKSKGVDSYGVSHENDSISWEIFGNKVENAGKVSVGPVIGNVCLDIASIPAIVPRKRIADPSIIKCYDAGIRRREILDQEKRKSLVKSSSDAGGSGDDDRYPIGRMVGSGFRGWVLNKERCGDRKKINERWDCYVFHQNF